MQLYSYLVIENGLPYQNGDRIELLQTKALLLGRSSLVHKPDIAFSSQYISRRHAAITYQKERYFLRDLSSTHGTQINGNDLRPEEPYPLKNGDRITFVKGLVSICYLEETDLENTISFPKLSSLREEPLCFDLGKRQIWLNGSILNLTGKSQDLLLLLYENKNRAVSYDEIKKRVWPERLITDQQMPDVANEEVNALVYRIRKQLGPNYSQCIVTVARYGLVLNL